MWYLLRYCDQLLNTWFQVSWGLWEAQRYPRPCGESEAESCLAGPMDIARTFAGDTDYEAPVTSQKNTVLSKSFFFLIGLANLASPVASLFNGTNTYRDDLRPALPRLP